MRRLFLLIILFLAPTARATDALPELWVYVQTNLLVDQNVDDLAKLFNRAGNAGYSHVMLADYKTEMLDLLGENRKHYLANVERVKQLATTDHLQIVPSVFSMGSSNAILAHDPNLAEGLPVIDTPLVVNGGDAKVDSTTALGKLAFKDDSVRLHDGIAEMPSDTGNSRLNFRITSPKFRCYHVHAEVKTDDFHGDARVNALGDNQSLIAMDSIEAGTHDWRPIDVVFDSLEHASIGIYFGAWGGHRGTIAWRNWKIAEVAGVNVLRRDGTPLKLTSGSRTLVEGQDFDRITDPKLGNQPWAGSYTAWHAPPTILTHGLADGTKLAMSWSYAPIELAEQVAICMSDPKTYDLLVKQAKFVRATWGSPGYMMSHDEIRCANWDEACQSRGLDAGAVLADNVKRCTALLDGSDVYVWSDMFDPNHNAVDHYYFTRGSNAGSWEGLSPAVTVVNWNFEHRNESLKFFADRGNRQLIAGYYDGNVRQIEKWIAAATEVKGVVGYMNTTWQHKYDDLEGFATLCR